MIPRNLRRIASIVLMLPFTSLCSGQTSSTATDHESLRKKEAEMETMTQLTTTLPHTPQEMWDRILTLLKINDGFVSKKDIEHTLGFRFTKTEAETSPPTLGAKYLHTFTEEIVGLKEVQITMRDDPLRIDYSVSWGAERTELPECLQHAQVVNDLEMRGWVAYPRSVAPSVWGGQLFRLPSDIEKIGTGEVNDLSTVNDLHIRMPNQFSQCVIAFDATFLRP